MSRNKKTPKGETAIGADVNKVENDMPENKVVIAPAEPENKPSEPVKPDIKNSNSSPKARTRKAKTAAKKPTEKAASDEEISARGEAVVHNDEAELPVIEYKPASENEPVISAEKDDEKTAENVPLKSAIKSVLKSLESIVNKTADFVSGFEALIKTKKDKTSDNIKSGGKPDKNVAVLNDAETGAEFWNNSKKHVFSANPVFVKAIAIVPILGAATSLKNGILLSGAMILTLVLLSVIMYPVNKHLPRGYRTVTAFTAAGIVITPVCMLANYLAPSVTALCGIYLPLLAVCAIPMIEKKHYGVRFGIFKTAFVALLDGLGFAFAAVVVSVIREIFGSGTLYDRPLPGILQIKFSFALLPAGAFLLLGLLIALFKKIYGVTEDDEEEKE